MARIRGIKSKLDRVVKAVRPARNIVVRRRRSSGQLFLVFKGIVDKLMMEPAAFLAETGLLSRNVVMLRDPDKAFYQRGVGADIPDFDALIAHLQGIRDGMPHVREVYCVGTSMGAYAAVAAGARLRADGVFAFGLMTDLEDTRIARQTGLIERLGRPSEQLDLRSVLAEPNGVTRYDVYFSEAHEVDRQRAQRIADLEGVVLHAVPGVDHNVIRTLSTTGALGSIMPIDQGVAR